MRGSADAEETVADDATDDAADGGAESPAAVASVPIGAA